MIPLVIIPPLNDVELLGRVVSSRREAKNCRGDEVPASVFSYPDNFKISVDRVDRMTSSEAVRHGEHVCFSLRGANRLFCGWALLSRPDVLVAGCGCRASPMSDNFWHADILMPEDAAFDPGMHEDRASRLARRSYWRDRSDA